MEVWRRQKEGRGVFHVRKTSGAFRRAGNKLIGPMGWHILWNIQISEHDGKVFR